MSDWPEMVWIINTYESKGGKHTGTIPCVFKTKVAADKWITMNAELVGWYNSECAFVYDEEDVDNYRA